MKCQSDLNLYRLFSTSRSYKIESKKSIVLHLYQVQIEITSFLKFYRLRIFFSSDFYKPNPNTLLHPFRKPPEWVPCWEPISCSRQRSSRSPRYAQCSTSPSVHPAWEWRQTDRSRKSPRVLKSLNLVLETLNWRRARLPLCNRGNG